MCYVSSWERPGSTPHLNEGGTSGAQRLSTSTETSQRMGHSEGNDHACDAPPSSGSAAHYDIQHRQPEPSANRSLPGRLLMALLWGLVTLAASAPFWLRLPPPAALVAEQVQRVSSSGDAAAISLPDVRPTPDNWTHYRLNFTELPTQRPLHLYVPLLSQRAIIEAAGYRLADSQTRVMMSGQSSGATMLVPLPSELLTGGTLTVDLHLQTPPILRGFLSPVYLGSSAEVAPHYRLKVFLLEYLRLMVPAGQLVIAIAVLGVWLYRPREPLFGWLALLLPLSLLNYAGLLRDLIPQLEHWLPYLFMISMGAGPALAAVTLLIHDLAPPRWLKASVVALPALSLALAAAGVSTHWLVIGLSLPVGLLGLVASLGISAWGAFHRHSDARLLLMPLLLAVSAATHDIMVLAGWMEGPIMLSIYYRPLLMIGIALILMRRLALSLRQLDNVNSYLTRRLAQREAELARLYEEEQRDAVRLVRSEERQRLTVDLHDGLSGYLASIIAMAERDQTTHIERTAREALDDLRVVILSLDVCEGELGMALGGFRERMERQLKRLGTELIWSTSQLPEISGVTPSQALNLLRILQEAITNAVKHGHARRIEVHGTTGPDGRGYLTVENDGAPFPAAPPRGGTGLNNIRRRIRQLDGEVLIEPLPAGTRLTVILPTRLPAPTTPQGAPLIRLS